MLALLTRRRPYDGKTPRPPLWPRLSILMLKMPKMRRDYRIPKNAARITRQVRCKQDMGAVPQRGGPCWPQHQPASRNRSIGAPLATTPQSATRLQ